MHALTAPLAEKRLPLPCLWNLPHDVWTNAVDVSHPKGACLEGPTFHPLRSDISKGQRSTYCTSDLKGLTDKRHIGCLKLNTLEGLIYRGIVLGVYPSSVAYATLFEQLSSDVGAVCYQAVHAQVQHLAHALAVVHRPG